MMILFLLDDFIHLYKIDTQKWSACAHVELISNETIRKNGENDGKNVEKPIRIQTFNRIYSYIVLFHFCLC